MSNSKCLAQKAMHLYDQQGEDEMISFVRQRLDPRPTGHEHNPSSLAVLDDHSAIPVRNDPLSLPLDTVRRRTPTSPAPRPQPETAGPALPHTDPGPPPEHRRPRHQGTDRLRNTEAYRDQRPPRPRPVRSRQLDRRRPPDDR